MANINQTTLSKAVGPTSAEVFIPLASLATIAVNDQLLVDREQMHVSALVPTVTPPGVRVRRGVSGTISTSHAPGAIVTTGPPTAFNVTDPVGVPPAGQQPYWINTKTGAIWVAQGDETGPGTLARYWQLQVTTQARGALGIRTTSIVPTQAVQ